MGAGSVKSGPTAAADLGFPAADGQRQRPGRRERLPPTACLPRSPTGRAPEGGHRVGAGARAEQSAGPGEAEDAITRAAACAEEPSKGPTARDPVRTGEAKGEAAEKPLGPGAERLASRRRAWVGSRRLPS